MRRVFECVLAAWLIVLLCFSALAQEESCGPQALWSLSPNGVLTIRGSGPMDDYASRASVPWFAQGCTGQIVAVRPEEGITAIGSYAFYDCSAMTETLLPASLTRIGARAFHSCTALPCIVLPEKLTVIEPYTFYGCSSLTMVTLPAGLTTIGSHAFDRCNRLQNVFFQGTAQQMEAIAVADGNEALLNAEWICLTEAEGMTMRLPGALTVLSDEALCGTAAECVVLPEGLSMLGERVWEGCQALKTIINHSALTVDAPEKVDVRTVP